MGINTRDFVLMLLDASKGILESETRIQKLAFLGIQEEGLPRFTHFVWEKYGPLSKEMWRTLHKMEREGLLDIREEKRTTFMGDPYKLRIFELTEEGHREASELERIHDNEFILVNKLFIKYGDEPLDSLLNYVHTAYSPDDL